MVFGRAAGLILTKASNSYRRVVGCEVHIRRFIPRARAGSRSLSAAVFALSLCVVLYGQSLAPPTNLRLVSPSPDPPPPPSGTAHAYFNALLDRKDHWRSYSLRDQAQLTLYSQRPQDINYVWPNDPDPRRQDAAKLIIPSDGSGTGSGGPYPWNEENRNSIHQVRVPTDGMELGHAYLVTWDAWYGDEWRWEISGVNGYKAFQFDGPDRMNGAAKIWWEISQRIQPFSNQTGLNFYPQSGDISRLVVRHYASPYDPETELGVPVGPNVTSGSTSSTPTTPVKPWNIKPETWTRYWQLIEYGMDPQPWRSNPPGTLMSLWCADENRGAVQIYDRLQVTLWPPGMRKFWIEFNTSLNEVKAGRPNLVAYFRNIVVLKDVSYQDVPSLLQRPVR